MEIASQEKRSQASDSANFVSGESAVKLVPAVGTSRDEAPGSRKTISRGKGKESSDTACASRSSSH